MTDTRARKHERTLAAEGTAAARALVLQEKLRSGEFQADEVRLYSRLGDHIARIVFPDEPLAADVDEMSVGKEETRGGCVFCGKTVVHFNDGGRGWLVSALVDRGEGMRERLFMYCCYPGCTAANAARRLAEETGDHHAHDPVWRCGCSPSYVENVGRWCGNCHKTRANAVPWEEGADAEIIQAIRSWPSSHTEDEVTLCSYVRQRFGRDLTLEEATRLMHSARVHERPVAEQHVADSMAHDEPDDGDGSHDFNEDGPETSGFLPTEPGDANAAHGVLRPGDDPNPTQINGAVGNPSHPFHAPAMPACHCGKHAAIGVGFNSDPLYLCTRHWRAFQRVRDKVRERFQLNTADADCHVAARVLVALGRPDPYERGA